jgi:hypothetical protein
LWIPFYGTECFTQTQEVVANINKWASRFVSDDHVKQLRIKQTKAYITRLLFVFSNVLDDYLEPILYIPVPQSGQVAFIAGFPFFMVTCSGFDTSFFALHFTQYIVVMIELTSSQITVILEQPILHRTKIDDDFKRNDARDYDRAFKHILLKI